MYLKARNLSAVYGRYGLFNLNFTINKGDKLLLAGANGSGKSLTLKALSGLIPLDAGEALLNGANIQVCQKELRSRVGILLQDAKAQIVGHTVWEDVNFGLECQKLPKKQRAEQAEQALKQMNLWQKKEEPPFNLSGGELRRLGIAGLLAVNCDYFLFDEPFANLDYPNILDALRAMQRLIEHNKTLVVATHEIEKFYSLATRIAILQEGSLVFEAGMPCGHDLPWKSFSLRNPFAKPLKWL